MHNRVTMMDVAERANVSHSTVSRVLSGRAGVHPATQDIVLDAVRSLGYRVNTGARSLAGGRSAVIGVVVYEFTSHYTAQFVAALELTLRKNGYAMMLASAGGFEEDPDEHIATLVQQNICDGLILLFPSYHSFFLDERNRQTLPFVLIDQPGSAVADSVSIDNVGGTRLAIEHLAGLGHRRIGYIGGHMRTAAGKDRLTSYRSAVREFGLVDDPALVVDGDFKQQAGFQATATLLALDDPPTAVFAGSDEAALGVINACLEHGLEVPNDLSVVGFDDLQAANNARPSLTTVRQPLEQVADRALAQLLRRLDLPNLAFEHSQLATELVVRSSTAPPRSESVADR